MNIDCESLKTYLGHLSYVEQCQPLIVVFENVDSAADEATGDSSSEVTNNVDAIIKHLDAMGYTAYAWIANSADFGVPQSRARLFVLGLRRNAKEHGVRSKSDEKRLWEAVRRTVLLFKVMPVDYRRVLLPSSDAAVQNELKRRQLIEDTNVGVEWPALHRYWYRQKHLRWGAESPCESTAA